MLRILFLALLLSLPALAQSPMPARQVSVETNGWANVAPTGATAQAVFQWFAENWPAFDSEGWVEIAPATDTLQDAFGWLDAWISTNAQPVLDAYYATSFLPGTNIVGAAYSNGQWTVNSQTSGLLSGTNITAEATTNQTPSVTFADGTWTILVPESAQGAGASGFYESGPTNYYRATDRKAANVDGGTFSAGSWVARALNHEEYSGLDAASLSSDTVTLLPGRYWVLATAPAYEVGPHVVRVAVTPSGSGATYYEGPHANASGDGGSDDVRASVSFFLEIPSTYDNAALVVQHRGKTEKTGNGLGRQSEIASYSIYATLEIWKIGDVE
jgi:hypothetical protein